MHRKSMTHILAAAPIFATIALTVAFAYGDFALPGRINIAIFYASSVVVSGWSRSRRFLWITTGVCVLLTYAGLVVGPQPPVADVTYLLFNRSFVAVGLVIIAAMMQQRMEMQDRVEEARNRQVRQNEMLRQTDQELRRLNQELEQRVSGEVNRRLGVERELYQLQKMEAIGQLTSGLAHDFNNILTVIIGNLNRIATCSPADDPCRRFAENGLHSAQQGATLIKRLLGFARHQPLPPEVITIERALDEAMTLARPLMNEEIKFSLELGSDVLRCFANQAELQSALLNLMINARDAMPGGGVITVAAQNVRLETDTPDLGSGEYVRLSIADTGTGMPPEVATRVFEPFFTTKDAGKGSGLGLSMVYGFARQSGGTVRVESAPGRGTTVSLVLPRELSMPIKKANAESGAASHV